MLAAGCAGASSPAPAATGTAASAISLTPKVPRPKPAATTDPREVVIADNCSAASTSSLAALGAHLFVTRGVQLDRPAVLLADGVGTSRGQASRYTYLAGEVEKNGEIQGPGVWAAVDPNGHDWLSVNTLAQRWSSWPSATGTDADIQRNVDRYSLAVDCTASGGFPGGPPFSPPPDGQ